MLTKVDLIWHGTYEDLGDSTREAIDAAFDACVAELRGLRYAAANDDHAEALIAAITRYIIESND